MQGRFIYEKRNDCACEMEVLSPMALVMTPHRKQPAATTLVRSALSPIRPLSGDASACARHFFAVNIAWQQSDLWPRKQHVKKGPILMTLGTKYKVDRRRSMCQPGGCGSCLDKRSAQCERPKLRRRGIQRAADKIKHRRQHLHRIV